MPGKKVKNAVEILRRHERKNPRYTRLVEEERQRLRLAEMIREARERAGLTQADLARMIGTSQAAIARVEDTDYDRITFSTLLRIAGALSVRPSIRFIPLTSGAQADSPRGGPMAVAERQARYVTKRGPNRKVVRKRKAKTSA